jgi:N-acetylmuramic acid 6-phosphate etherase
MVDMQLSNYKLVQRGIDMICGEINVAQEDAKTLLETHGSVRKAIDAHLKTTQP